IWLDRGSLVAAAATRSAPADASRGLAITLAYRFLDIGLAHGSLLTAGYRFGFDRLVARAAFGEEEGQDVLQRMGVRGVTQEGAFAAHLHQVLVLELFEMMGERRGRDAKLRADLAHH